MKLLSLLPTLLLCEISCAELAVTVHDSQLDITRDGTLLASYRGDTRVPCIYPLLGPGGTNLTRHYPLKQDVTGEAHDHPHHVSFWMAHGKVNDADFWHKKEDRIVHQKFSPPEVSQEAQTVSFVVTLSWQTKGKELLQEQRRYSFDFSRANTYLIDTSSQLTASDQDVVFGDTKEGTFGFRVTPTLRLKGEQAKGHILDSEGREDAACWGQRSKWVAYHGPDSANQAAVVTLMDHARNLRHPTWWHARDYGLLAANPFGQHHFEERKNEPKLGNYALEKGESLTQRYRLVLQKGKVQADRLEALWTEFSQIGEKAQP